MKKIMALVLLFAVSAFAGFQGFNGSTNLKLFNVLKCGPGLTCSKTGADGKFEVNWGNRPQVLEASGAAVTLTATQCGSTILGPTGTGAVQVNLPLASGNYGCRFSFVTRGTGNFDVNPNDLDQIAGLTNTVGDAIRNATVGNSVTVEAYTGTGWSPVAIYGTWSDIN